MNKPVIDESEVAVFSAKSWDHRSSLSSPRPLVMTLMWWGSAGYQTLSAWLQSKRIRSLHHIKLRHVPNHKWVTDLHEEGIMISCRPEFGLQLNVFLTQEASANSICLASLGSQLFLSKLIHLSTKVFK